MKAREPHQAYVIPGPCNTRSWTVAVPGSLKGSWQFGLLVMVSIRIAEEMSI